MFYEDCQKDMTGSLRKLAEFLGKPLADKDLPKLLDHLKFDNVKNNASINALINPQDPTVRALVRRGKVGGNPEMTKEISDKFDAWTAKNLKDSDLKFPL